MQPCPESAYRVPYLPPIGSDRRARFGRLLCTSGQSALILYDDYPWPQWAPLGRLYRVVPGTAGWQQIELLTMEATP